MELVLLQKLRNLPIPHRTVRILQTRKPDWGHGLCIELAKGHLVFRFPTCKKKSNDRFELDWQRTSSTSGIGAGHYSLVLRFPSQRNPVTIPLTIWNNNSSGKISGHVIPIRFGGPKTSEHALNRGCEMFLADATGLEIYKLSNSITVGGVSELPTQEPPQRRQPTAHSSNQSNSPAQPVPAEKTPVAETGLSPLPANLNIREGIYLYAQLNGDWIPVKVLAREAGGQIKVHWLGFSDSWDTSLKPDQLRLKTSDLKVLAP